MTERIISYIEDTLSGFINCSMIHLLQLLYFIIILKSKKGEMKNFDKYSWNLKKIVIYLQFLTTVS